MLSINSSRSKSRSAGFTLVELLIAISFFSFILLFISAGFIALNRQFVKGRTVRDVQNDARLVIEDITRSLRGATVSELSRLGSIQTDNQMCFGRSQYTWTPLSDYSDGDIRLVRTDYGGGPCLSRNLVTTANSTDLIGNNTVVQYIGVEDFGGITGLVKIIVVLSTTQDELITSDPTEANCETLQLSGDFSPEYCSVVKFETVVNIRNGG